MSGHNKWTQIKRQKGAVDAKRSKVFSMLSRQITLDAKKANGDKNHPALRKAIERAKAANMPNDNIDRAIKKATGGEGSELVEVMYEAYGPGGAALIITGITDNKNRTSQEIKHLLSLHGGNLAAQGAALWAFTKTDPDGTVGVTAGASWTANAPLPLPTTDQETLLKLITALEEHADIQNIYTNVADLEISTN